MARNRDAVSVQSSSGRLHDETVACPIAMSLLSKLREGVERIPTANPIATEDHRLREFGGDPSNYIQHEHEDEDWEELLNPMMKRAFGWGDHEMDESAKQMLHRGQNGLDGFIGFIEYFVMRRGLMGGLIEPKVMSVLKALDVACVTQSRLIMQSKLMKLTQISTPSQAPS